MSVTVETPPKPPPPKPPPRKHHCACGRFLGESAASAGYIVVKCPQCGMWRKLDFGNVLEYR